MMDFAAFRDFKLTARNLDRADISSRTVHGSDRRYARRAESTALNRQIAFVQNFIAARIGVVLPVQNHGVIGGNVKLAVGNGRYVPVQDRGLRSVGKCAAVNRHRAAVVILYGVETAGKLAAQNRQGGVRRIDALDIARPMRAAAIVLIAVFNHAGIRAFGNDLHAVANDH